MGILKPMNKMKVAFSKTKEKFRVLHQKYLFGKIPSDKYWYRWNSTVLEYLKVPQNKELAIKIQDKWFDNLEWEAYPKAERTISRLKGIGLKTGLITTAYEKEISLVLGKTNLQRSDFDIIVGADTIKEVKPHPEAFRYGLRKLKVRPNEALYIGDRVDQDYKAAEKVGIQSILVQRPTNKEKNFQGFRTIKNLEEIFSYIQ